MNGPQSLVSGICDIHVQFARKILKYFSICVATDTFCPPIQVSEDRNLNAAKHASRITSTSTKLLIRPQTMNPRTSSSIPGFFSVCRARRFVSGDRLRQPVHPLRIACDSLSHLSSKTQPNSSYRNLSQPISGEITFPRNTRSNR